MECARAGGGKGVGELAHSTQFWYRLQEALEMTKQLSNKALLILSARGARYAFVGYKHTQNH